MAESGNRGIRLRVSEFSIFRHTDCHSERSARGLQPRAEGEETAPPRPEVHEAAAVYSKEVPNVESARHMNVYDILRWAIIQMKPCRISKHGEPERFVCPIRIGLSSRGDRNVLYYQFGGYSSRGLQPDGSDRNWRCNHVADIATAEILNGPWHEPLNKPKTRGPCVKEIDEEVPF